jgi:hypothetical protein
LGGSGGNCGDGVNAALENAPCGPADDDGCNHDSKGPHEKTVRTIAEISLGWQRVAYRRPKAAGKITPEGIAARLGKDQPKRGDYRYQPKR